MDQVDEYIVSVRADTGTFAQDVRRMRGELEGPLASGAASAGRSIERSLAKALKDGRVGFGELKAVALDALGQIASGLARQAIGSSKGAGGGLGAMVGGVLANILGAPGRATGGPVSAGRPYRVGENGPEWFVPQSARRIERTGSGSRDVTVNIAISGSSARDEPAAMARSSRQIAAAIRQSLAVGR